MPTLEDIASIEQIKEEYRKSFLLNIFRKLCVKMNKDNLYHERLLKLFRQSHNGVLTTQMIIKKEFDYDLVEEEASVVYKWMKAYFNKNCTRKKISQDIKIKLNKQQKGLCVVCGEDLGKDWSKIHVDHIVPWVLVGDELEDNYQLLCDTCNQCKSSRTDYIFKSLIGLN